jgi:hypothetical protein
LQHQKILKLTKYQIQQISNEGDKVENTTEQAAPAVEPVAAPTVEPVQASRPVHYTAPRSPITNKVSYLEHYLKATILHDEDSRQYVKAADNTTSTAPGMIPTPQSTQIVNALANADRGMIDALSRETLVGEGMTFEIPLVTAVPTVANVAENAAVTDSSLSATFLSVPVQSFKGRAISTVELIDRSRPEYLTALLQNLEFAYAKATDEFAVGTIAGAGQQTGVNANTATGFLGYTSAAAGAVYSSSLGFARNIVVSPGQWTNIMGYNDNGAPLYNAAQPSNAAGNVRGDSLRGVVSPGLNLFVSRSIGNAGQQHPQEISPWLLLTQMHGLGMNHHALHCAQQFKAMEQSIFFTTVMQQSLQRFHLAHAGIRPDQYN